MLTKRIISCLDVGGGRVVKGVNFQNLKDTGDPVELAKQYNDDGADELVFLDIKATAEGRKTILKIVERIAKKVFIPFTVGGGVSTVEDMEVLLKKGADKISVNTKAIEKPQLISQAANIFGSQCIVVAIDVKKVDRKWRVFTYAGKKPTGKDAVSWAIQAAKLGAGEILLTSIDRDGTNIGFEITLIRTISESVPVPVIASGGAGNENDFLEVFREGKADAALAASLFHNKKLRLTDLKRYLYQKGLQVRQ